MYSNVDFYVYKHVYVHDYMCVIQFSIHGSSSVFINDCIHVQIYVNIDDFIHVYMYVYIYV